MADADKGASAARSEMPGSKKTYPKVQIFTVKDYFARKRPELPDTSSTLKKAQREKRAWDETEDLPLE